MSSRSRVGSGVADTCWRGVRTSSSLPEQGVLVGLQSDKCQRARSLLRVRSEQRPVRVCVYY